MTRSKKWIAGASLLIAALGLVGVGVFSLARVLGSREALQNSLVTQMQESLDAHVELEGMRFVFTPFPRHQATRLKLVLSSPNGSEWTAREAQFSFSLLSLLWGRIHISGFQIRGGEGNVFGIPLEKIEFKIKGLGPKKNSPFEWKAKVEGGKGT